MIQPYRGVMPSIHPSVFVVDSADVIGDVTIAAESSIWYQAVIRGDVNTIRIGERTNVQDGCLLHVRHERYPLVVGSEVTLGHGAILHACTVADRCLIGMGAIVLDNARINSYTLVAAGAVVTGGAEFPEGVLIAGVPAKVVRRLSEEERTSIRQSALNYLDYVRTYREAAS